MRTASTTPSPVIASATSRSGTCDVTRDVHRSPVMLNSLVKPSTPNTSCIQRSSSSCVIPAMRSACLLSGANTMPSTSPAFAAATAAPSAA